MPKQQLVKTSGLSFGAGQTADLEGITSREFASGSGAKLDESTLQHYVRGRLSDASIASALDEQGCQALLELSLVIWLPLLLYSLNNSRKPSR